MSNMHALEVSHIEPNTAEAVVVTLAVPASLASTFQFKAGQYITLESTIEGQTVRRSYSLCAAPDENLLQVGIKKVDQGVFSSFAHARLQVGDLLNVGVPEGRFVYSPENAPQVVGAFAAGSGITPILSIIKTHLTAQPENQFHLVYGNKSPEKTMFYEALQNLQAEFPSQLTIQWVFSQARKDKALFGRIDGSVVNFYQKQVETPAKVYYLCGPEGMIESVSQSLQKLGVNDDQIFTELFFTAAASGSTNASSDEVSLTVIHDAVQTTITTKRNATLLDAALKAKLDVPYSCQGGVCSSCIARIKTGKAEMQTNQILTDSEVQEGLILTCQALPQSQDLTVDYDDV
jgi:ring-1,2-phenylacetyl-CoA epoxidase subunit PaaE